MVYFLIFILDLLKQYQFPYECYRCGRLHTPDCITLARLPKVTTLTEVAASLDIRRTVSHRKINLYQGYQCGFDCELASNQR